MTPMTVVDGHSVFIFCRRRRRRRRQRGNAGAGRIVNMDEEPHRLARRRINNVSRRQKLPEHGGRSSLALNKSRPDTRLPGHLPSAGNHRRRHLFPG